MKPMAMRLREYVQAWSNDLLQHPLAQLARSGKLPAAALATYLESLRFIFASSEVSLRLAAKRSKEVADPALVSYFERKTREEVGHDSWAADDLQQLPAVVTSNLAPAHNAQRLVELQRELIAAHPLYFVAYILWAEYFSVLVGDAWLDALESSGYARPQVTSVAKHIEVDREHAAAVIDEVDALWHGEPSEAEMLQAVQRASRLFEALCTEILGVAQRAA